MVSSFSSQAARAGPGKCCFNCSSSELLHEGLMTVCKSCCTVNDIHSLDSSAEWRNFTGKDQTRCGVPASDIMPESCMSTFVGTGSGKMHFVMSRVCKFQIWNSMPYRERALFSATEFVTTVATNNGIPESIISDAKMLLKKAIEAGVTRGNNRKGLLACSVYAACLMNNVPRSVKEIATQFSVSPSSITKMAKRFLDTVSGVAHDTRPTDYVMRFCSELGMCESDSLECARVTAIAQDVLEGIMPVSCVAGCIFYVIKRSQHLTAGLNRQMVSSVCGVSETTITKCYKRLTEICMVK
jgi:transcription initiation factor TFIIB